jgi:DNA mismatch repair protein MutL
VIYAVIRSAVRQALGLSNLLDSINFDVEKSFEYQSPGTEHPIKNPFDSPKSDFNPFDKTVPDKNSTGLPWQKPSIKGWENLYDNTNVQFDRTPKNENLFGDISLPEESPEKEKTNVFQFRNRLIISSIKSGLVLIDQQRAYERIVYEQYLDRISQSQHVVQQELFPCQVSFSSSDAELLEEIMAEMNVLGFHLNKLGKNTFVVSGTPSGIEETDLQSLFESFLDNYKKNLIELDLDKSTNLARSLACSLSVRSARKLYTEEMVHLIDELFSCKVPDLTPDGRKIFAIIPEEQVNQWLNR